VKKSLVTATVVIVVFCASAPFALAQGSAVDAYGGSGGEQQSVVSDGSSSGLPFTGLDLIFVAVAGLGLLGSGLAMRRLVGQRDGPRR